MSKLIERFLEYVAYDTVSNRLSDSVPTSKGQKAFARLLRDQCERIGFDDVTLTGDGYVYCFLKGTKGGRSVGFIAHMDTSPDFNGSGVKPRIVKYEGGPIALNDLLTLSPERFPSLNEYVGQTLITTDGTTLLGADDKAGIAEIITALEYIIDKSLERPDIYVAFTPDEEIGRGMDNFDLTLFRPEYAYTVDGGGDGELEYECFNAARAVISITGEAVHPGYAKGIMKNAALIVGEFIESLPKTQIPAKTEGYEGFFHVCSVEADVSKAKIDIILRDFRRGGLEDRKKLLENIVRQLNVAYCETAKLDIKDEYHNMGEVISKKMEVVEIAKAAYEAAGIAPRVNPIRGGTDGARLTFMGIPCPNIFTGGRNFHGPYEYVPVESMRRAVSVIVNIIKILSDC